MVLIEQCSHCLKDIEIELPNSCCTQCLELQTPLCNNYGCEPASLLCDKCKDKNMSCKINEIYIENRIELFEDLVRLSFVEFEELDLNGKFKVLLKTPGTNARAAMKIYLDLKDLL